MSDLSVLPNIGKTLEAQLREGGIETEAQLRAAGSMGAWLRIQAADPSACYNRLCALEGALRGDRWHNLPDSVKQELKDFYNGHKL